MTSANNALTLRHGVKGQGECVPWAAEAIALEKGSNHTPSPGAELRQGTGFEVRFRDVVSAEPLYETVA